MLKYKYGISGVVQQWWSQHFWNSYKYVCNGRLNYNSYVSFNEAIQLMRNDGLPGFWSSSPNRLQRNRSNRKMLTYDRHMIFFVIFIRSTAIWYWFADRNHAKIKAFYFPRNQTITTYNFWPNKRAIVWRNVFFVKYIVCQTHILSVCSIHLFL